MPEDLESVAAVPAVEAIIVTRFPAVPFTLKFVTAYVAPDVNVKADGVTELLIVPIVTVTPVDDAIVKAPAPEFLTVPRENALTPQLKVLVPALVNVKVADAALKVVLVPVKFT